MVRGGVLPRGQHINTFLGASFSSFRMHISIDVVQQKGVVNE